jgi:hypothetical protein
MNFIAALVCHFNRKCSRCNSPAHQLWYLYVHFVYCASSLCADDILLLAPSVTELRLLLTTCERYLSDIGMNINVSKSTFTAGLNGASITSVKICVSHGDQLKWNVGCTYFGVHLVGPLLSRYIDIHLNFLSQNIHEIISD